MPIENSLEGSIDVTLDLLAERPGDLEIVGEALLRVRHSLIAPRTGRARRDRDRDHPPAGARAVRALPAHRAGARAGAARRARPPRRCARSSSRTSLARPRSGRCSRREIYGGTVLREGVRGPRATTKPASCGSPARATAATPPLRERSPAAGRRRRSCSGVPGRDSAAGSCAASTSSRAGHQPARRSSRARGASELGSYMFFVDLDGRIERDDRVAAAIAGLAARCERGPRARLLPRGDGHLAGTLSCGRGPGIERRDPGCPATLPP